MCALAALSGALGSPAAVAAPELVERDLHVDGLRLRLVEAGARDRPPVLLLHGFMTSSTALADLQQRLAERYRVFALDLPGHGQSDRPARPLTGFYLAAAVGRALEVLELRDVVVVGHSMGALVAIVLAERWPGRIRSVVAVSPAGFAFDPLRQVGMRLLARPAIWAAEPALVYEIAAHGSVVRFGDGKRADLEQQLRLRRDRDWCRCVASAYRTLATSDLAPLARRAKRPIELVFGARDQALPPDYRARVIAALPGAPRLEIEDCGHDVHRDAPEQLIEVIDRARARPHGPPDGARR
ncbi:MAG: alpha/beta fold hydrolase [Deltaproteobacteria bacterium]|nr:alpha/beta fold hydrolase [Deltaproteobacteria bacterium]